MPASAIRTSSASALSCTRPLASKCSTREMRNERASSRRARSADALSEETEEQDSTAARTAGASASDRRCSAQQCSRERAMESSDADRSTSFASACAMPPCLRDRAQRCDGRKCRVVKKGTMHLLLGACAACCLLERLLRGHARPRHGRTTTFSSALVRTIGGTALIFFEEMLICFAMSFP